MRPSLRPAMAWAGLAAALAGALLWQAGPIARACGIWEVRPVFHDVLRCQGREVDELKSGQGILRPGMPMETLVYAYRHLAGLPVAEAAFTMTYPRYGSPTGTTDWQSARAAVMGGDGPRLALGGHYQYAYYSRVEDPALAMAARTLNARAALAEVRQEDLKAWVQAQDQVFASRPEAPLIPDAAQGPDWLRRDRAYQRAAALFYANQFAPSRAACAAIIADPGSPWRAWADYLRARCWVREAFFGARDEARAPLAEAKAALVRILADPARAGIREESRRYLELVRFRLEPGTLKAQALASLSRARLEPEEGARALNLLRDAERFEREVEPRPAPPVQLTPAAQDLSDWLGFMAPRRPDHPRSALARWQRGHSLPWLVATLATLPAGDPAWSACRKAAAPFLGNPQAARTLRWQLLAHDAEALPWQTFRPIVAAAAKEEWPAWAGNQIRSWRRANADSLDAWADAMLSQVVDVREWELNDPGHRWSSRGGLSPRLRARFGDGPALLDDDAASQINRQFPLNRLADLVQRPGLPPALREDLAAMAWTRAMLLGRLDLAARVRPALPPRLEKLTQGDLGKLDEPARLETLAVFLINFPGVSPWLKPGFGRRGERDLALEKYDEVPGNNFWDADAVAAWTVPTRPLAFLAPEERAVLEKEQAGLRAFASARPWFGAVILQRARAHPDDPKVPQFLGQFILSARLAAPQPDPEQLGQVQVAVGLLRDRYPTSPWYTRLPKEMQN